MCITKWRTASLKTMNNALDFNNQLVRALIARAGVYFPAIFSKLSILYIFPIKESYTAA